MAKRKRVETLIVEALIYDISDRRGLKHEWNAIDAEVQREIRATWRKIIRRLLKQQASPRKANANEA